MMGEQLLGAASACVLVLAYVLIVQTMTAAVVLLCEFILIRVRILWAMVPRPGDRPEVDRSIVGDVDGPNAGPLYRLGGGIRLW
jgi:hypothetical protein